MTAPDLFEPDRSEPLSVSLRTLSAPAAFGDARCHRLEFSSRGDRVNGRVVIPNESRGPAPLVLLQHGLGGSIDSPYMEAAAPWVRGGAAVGCIDLPLHGERASAKLSDRLLTSVAIGAAQRKADGEDGLDGSSRMLWMEFARQSVLDLQRALDAILAFPEIDEDRAAFAGFSLGAMLGTIFCARDERPRAAALALAGGGFGPESVDPCRYVGEIAPRPVLFVNATRDERISREASEALHHAAGGAGRVEWFDCTHAELPGTALKAMWIFLRKPLDLEATP